MNIRKGGYIEWQIFKVTELTQQDFQAGQIKFHIIAFPLVNIYDPSGSIPYMETLLNHLGELFKFPPTIFAHNPTLDNFKNLYELSRFYRYSNVKILLELNDSYCAYSSS